MKKIFPVLLFLLAFASSQAQNLQANLSKAYDATAQVYTQLIPNGSWKAIGTAWMYGNTHTFVTAKHITSGFEAGGFGTLHWVGIKLQLSDNSFVMVPLKQIHESPYFDASIIILDKTTVKGKFTPLKLNTKNPHVGDSICGVGFPLGYDQIAFNGILTGITDYNLTPYMLTNAVINPGHSGSAVLNADGDVIGMIIAKDTRTESINYILPAIFIVGAGKPHPLVGGDECRVNPFC